MRTVSRSKSPGTSSLRKGRFSGPNQIYHVISCTDGLVPLFDDLFLARIVIQAMKREDDAGHTRTLAFVVMPDHLHWLFQLVGVRTLPVCINTMKSFASRRINSIIGCSGPRWQKGFYDRAVRRDVDIKAVANYIIANPIRAGLTESVRDFSHWDAKWV